MADDLAQGRRLFRRADEPVDAEHLRLLGAGFDQIGDAEAIAGGMEIAVVIGGQHGDGENLQVRSGARLDRGLHGLRIGVHGEEGCAQGRDALDAARDGIADIVQLEIDENLLAAHSPARAPAASRRHKPADSRSCRRSRCRRACAIIASAAATPGRSSATINRSLGAILAGCMSPHIMRWETSISCRTSACSASISAGCFKLIHIVIGVFGKRQRELVRNDRRMAGGQDQPQRRQRTACRRAGLPRLPRSQTRVRETPGRGSRARSCTRLTQSMVFLTSAGTEELYSGVTIRTP